MDVDYGRVGLKVGIEIHRQLDTEHKLFCSCPTKLFTEKPTVTFTRRLRPTQSELGQLDPAALFEFQKGRVIEYDADSETSCLVEADEEPPHDLNPKAIHVGLQVSTILNSKPVDEIHVMRKTVIDGSNTCGFQRTCIIALGGSLTVEGKEITIQTVSLEEDAARKIGEEELRINYRLDRLGIPLIEVATAPVITSAEESERVALAIGKILKRTGKVKRGIGTIRQDLNVSIRNGALVEVKGVQELSLISKVVEYEVQRQLMLLKIKDDMVRRNVSPNELEAKFVDMTEIFKETKSQILSKAIDTGGVVLAVKLQKMAGLLKMELSPKLRFGTELSDVAKFYGGVGGIFHTDELPGYGISQIEVERLKTEMRLGETDAAVIVADHKDKARKALEALIKRTLESLRIIPDETRLAKPDGTTRYMRPRPGAARLYPETDVPPIPVSSSLLKKVRETLPPPPEELVDRLVCEFKVNKKIAEQLSDSDYLFIFEKIVRSMPIVPTFVATALTETMKSLERKGFAVENISDELLLSVFKLIDEGKTAKESFPDIIEWIAKSGGSPIDAVEHLGLQALTREEIESIIHKKIKQNSYILDQPPDKAYGLMMKIVMSELRGKVDAMQVAQILKEKMKM